MKDEEKKIWEKSRKQEEEYKKWKNSIEGIMYELSERVFGDTFGDESEIVIIAKTLQRVPEEVREKVLYEAYFILFLDSYGTMINLPLISWVFPAITDEEIDLRDNDATIPVSTLNKIGFKIRLPLILLNFNAMREKPDSEKMDTTAHEIAHFVLGHENPTSDPKAEREADDLIEKWGFKRGYESYEQFEKVI